MATERTIMITIGADGRAALAEMDKVNGGLRGVANESKLMDQAVKYAGTSIAATLSTSLVKAAIDAAIQMDSLSKKFAVFAGSADLGARELKFVRDAADSLGLAVAPLTESYGRFMNAIKGTSNEGEKGREAFIGISKGMAAIGMSADGQSRAWAQLNQGIMKGKFEMEDLKTITEAGLPVFQLMADALEIDVEKLLKMQKEGKLLVEDVLPKLGSSMEKAFGSAAAEAANSAQANMERFNNSLTDLKIATGTVFLPAITEMVKSLTGLVKDGMNPVVSGAVAVQAEIIRLGMLVDKAGGSLTTFNYAFYKTAELATRFVSIGQFGDGFKNAADNADRFNKMYQQRYNDKDARLTELAQYELGLSTGKPSSSAYTAAEISAQAGNKRQAPVDESAKKAAQARIDAKNKELADIYELEARDMQRRVDLANTEAAQIYEITARDMERKKAEMADEAAMEYQQSIARQEAAMQDAYKLSEWRAKGDESRALELQSIAEFEAMKQGLHDGGYAQELESLNQQQLALEYQYAWNTDSFEVHERRKAEIQSYYDTLRSNASIKNEQRLAQIKLQTNQNYLAAFSTITNAINQIAGGRNAAFYALTQAAAIAVTFLSTEAAAAAAIAPPPLGLGPIAGAPLATSIKVSGYASMAAMAAATIANMVASPSGADTPSSPGATLTGINSIGTQTVAEPAQPQPPSVQVHVYGNVMGDADQIARSLMQSIQKAVKDGYTL